MERFEHAEEAAEARESFARRAAVLVAVLAAGLAIAGLLATRATEEVLLQQQMASDSYSEYQANSLKKHVNDDAAGTLRIVTTGTANEKAGADAAAKLLQANNDKYIPAQARLLPVAREHEHERDVAAAKHTSYQVAEAALQLGIVLCSIAIISRARWLLGIGAGLGLAGAILIVNGHFLLVRLPAI